MGSNILQILSDGIKFIGMWFPILFTGFILIYYVDDLFRCTLLKIVSTYFKRLEILEKSFNMYVKLTHTSILELPTLDVDNCARHGLRFGTFKDAFLKAVVADRYCIQIIRIYRVISLMLAEYFFILNFVNDTAKYTISACIFIILAELLNYRKLFFWDGYSAIIKIYNYMQVLLLLFLYSLFAIFIVALSGNIIVVNRNSFILLVIFTLIEIFRMMICESQYRKEILNYCFDMVKKDESYADNSILKYMQSADNYKYYTLIKQYAWKNVKDNFTQMNEALQKELNTATIKNAVIALIGFNHNMLVNLLLESRKFGMADDKPYEPTCNSNLQTFDIEFSETVTEFITAVSDILKE